MDADILAIVVVPLVRSPDLCVRELGFRIRDSGAVLLTELLAELGRAYRTDLHALSAGDALLFLHVRAVSGGRHVRRVVELGRAQGVADAYGAVADGNDLILAVNVGDLVDIAVTLGTLEDLIDFFPRNIAADSAVILIFGEIAAGDTELSAHLAGSLSSHALLLAAGALGDTELIILFKPVGEMLDGDGFVLHADCLLDRDDMHADSGAALGDHLGDAAERKLCHQVEEGGKLRELVREGGLHHHEFRGARDEDRQIILFVLVLTLARHLDDADPAELFHHVLRVLNGHFVDAGKLPDGVGYARFLEIQKEADLLLCEDHVQHPVFRIPVVDRSRKFFYIAVRYDARELQDHLFLFLVGGDVVGVLPVIPLVDHGIADFPFFNTFSHSDLS